MREQETHKQYCKSYDVAVELLNNWPNVHSTDETVAHIDHFQIIPDKVMGVMVFILWRQVER